MNAFVIVQVMFSDEKFIENIGKTTKTKVKAIRVMLERLGPLVQLELLANLAPPAQQVSQAHPAQQDPKAIQDPQVPPEPQVPKETPA